MKTADTARSVPTTGVPAAPPLPADLQALLHKLRLPHIRAAAPQIVATAKAQRWEPVEVLKALFAEEAAGRDRSALATRRAAASFPTGKTFDAWASEASSIPAPTQQAWRVRPDLEGQSGVYQPEVENVRGQGCGAPGGERGNGAGDHGGKWPVDPGRRQLCQELGPCRVPVGPM